MKMMSTGINLATVISLSHRFKYNAFVYEPYLNNNASMPVYRSTGPVDIEHFRSLMVENSCEKAEDKLMSSWFNQVMALFSGESSLITDIKLSPSQMNRFYECTSTLIANQVSILKSWEYYI